MSVILIVVGAILVLHGLNRLKWASAERRLLDRPSAWEIANLGLEGIRRDKKRLESVSGLYVFEIAAGIVSIGIAIALLLV